MNFYLIKTEFIRINPSTSPNKYSVGAEPSLTTYRLTEDMKQTS